MSPVAAILNTDQAALDAVMFRRLLAESGAASAEISIDRCAGLASAPMAGSKTMACCASDGRVSVVFDGRLDDRGLLAASLGHARLPGQAGRMSDAELIVSAYDRWAEDCVSHLLGDFAFCLWDGRTRRLFCARDHFGVKPMYYAHVGHTLIVSSSLRWLRRYPGVSCRLRKESIGDFLLFGVCQQSHTAFADISRVPPGHRLCYALASGRCELTRYWTLEPREPFRHRDPGAYVEEFWRLLCQAVADRVGAGPVGVLMSGGLDSSSVTAAAIDATGPSARHRLHAYTIVSGQMSDVEGRLASVFAAEHDIQISQIPIQHYQPFDRWESDDRPPEPTLEALSTVMLDVLDLASRHGNVVLTGDGGDLLLLPTSLLDQIGHLALTSLAGDLIRSLRLRLRPPLGLASRIRQRRTSEDVPGWLADDLLDHFDPHARWREVRDGRSRCRGARSAAFDQITDPWWTSMFEGLDPGATARPVEVRYPFFDVRLATFALRLPSFPWCLDKHVLREATRGKLPNAIRTRPKTPLAADPVSRAAQWSSQRAVELFERTPEMAGFVDARKFGSIVRGDSLLSNESLSAWAAISLAMWLHQGQRSQVKGKG